MSGTAVLTSGGAATSAPRTAPAQGTELFADAPARAAKAAADQSYGTAKRSRYVSFRADALPKTATGQRISLGFFDDASFSGTIDHVDKQDLLTSWSGPLDTAGGVFVVTKSGDSYSALASTTQGSFTMQLTASGLYQLQEVKQPTPSGEDEVTSEQSSDGIVAPRRVEKTATKTTLAAKSAAVSGAPAEKRRKKKVKGGDNGSVTDVLVMYTPAAAAAYGGVAGIQAEAAKNIGYTNASYANTGVRTTARLVGVLPTATNEVGGAGILKDLKALGRPRDGKFDEARTYIKQTHADDTILLVAPPPADAPICGIANLHKGQPAKYAFGVVSTGDCTNGYYSFPHELGHNQGLAHDPWTLKHSSVGKGSLRDAQFKYAHGYVSPNYAFYTTMAYYEECYYEGGVYCPQLLAFSNPKLAYAGQPLGTKKISYSVKALNKTRKTVARHQQSQLYATPVHIKPAPRFRHGSVRASFQPWVNGGVKYRYQWYRDGAPIKKAKHRSYRPSRKDVGHQLSVVVTGSKRYYAPVAVGSNARKVKGPGKGR